MVVLQSSLHIKQHKQIVHTRTCIAIYQEKTYLDNKLDLLIGPSGDCFKMIRQYQPFSQENLIVEHVLFQAASAYLTFISTADFSLVVY